MGWFERSAILSNNKIPISRFLRHQLTQPQSRGVYWSYREEDLVLALSDYSLEVPGKNMFESAGHSVITDKGKYVRPPMKNLPVVFFRLYEYGTRYVAEKLSEETGIPKEEIQRITRVRGEGAELEDRIQSMKEEVPGKVVFFYSSNALLEESHMVAFLFSEDRFSGSFDHAAIGVEGMSTSVTRINNVELLGKGGIQMRELAEKLEDDFIQEYR